MTITQSLEPIRRPEYTGENRCLPCTVVNVLIAAVVSGLLGFVSISLMVGTFFAFLGTIYLRGYLVPGTPELTKRYLPESVLRLFGKSIVDRSFDETISNDETMDVETILSEAGAITDCPAGTDLCLSPAFHEAWIDRIDRTWWETAADDVAAVFDLSVVGDELVLEDRDDAFVVESDGFPVGQWESRAAFVADMTAAIELRARYPAWDDLDNETRNRALSALRVFLDHCPSCDGVLEMGSETVSSCCSSYDIFAITCADCDARLFEIDASALEA